MHEYFGFTTFALPTGRTITVARFFARRTRENWLKGSLDTIRSAELEALPEFAKLVLNDPTPLIIQPAVGTLPEYIVAATLLSSALETEDPIMASLVQAAWFTDVSPQSPTDVVRDLLTSLSWEEVAVDISLS